MKRKSKLCALTGFLLLGTLSVGFLTGCDPEVPPIVEFDGYSVNLTFDNTKGNVTASKTSGSQSEEVTITVTPNEHYSVSKVTINNDSKAISSDGTYKFTTIEGDNNVVVEFIGEEVSLEVTQASNGEITYEGDTPLRYGDEVDVTFTPSEGYVLYSFTFNGEEVVGDDESITLTLDNYPTNTLTASFILEQTEVSTTLTINPSEHGTVTPSKTEGYVVGEEITLTITPETGYELDTLTFNGEEVSVTNNTATIILEEEENVVSATFKLIEVVKEDATITLRYDNTKGSVTYPTGEYKEGDKVTLTITPNDGYRISIITHNDTNISDLNTREFTLAAGENTIQVNFFDDTPVTRDLYIQAPSGMNNMGVNGYIYQFDTYNGELADTPWPGTLTEYKKYNVLGLEETLYYIEDVDITNYNNLIFNTKYEDNTSTYAQTIDIDIISIRDDELTNLIVIGDTLTEGKYSDITFKNYEETYKATIDITEGIQNGSISVANATNLYAGDQVEVTITPSEGYKLETLTHNGKSVSANQEGKYIITLSAGVNTLNATFISAEVVTPATVNLKFDESKGSASIGDITNLKVGDTISLTATPNTNFTLSKVLFNGEEITNYESILITEEENELIVQFYTEEYETTDLYFKDLGGMNNPSTHGIIYLFNDKDGMENGKFGSTEIDFVTYNADEDNANYYLAEDIDITNYDHLIFAVIDNNGTTRGQTQNLLISDIGENNLYSLTGTFDEISENKVYEGSFGTIAQQTLTINETTNGTVTANKTTGIKGEEVVLTVTPEEGYELESLTFNSEEVTPTEGTYKINLVEGENIINATFKEIVVPVDTYTIYFKDASWWNSDNAATHIFLYNGDTLLNGDNGELMTYMDNPGYDAINQFNVWSYVIDPTEVTSVEFRRYNPSDATNYWGALTGKYTLDEGTNLYTLANEAAWDGKLAGTTESFVNVEEDLLQDEVVITTIVNNDSYGSIDLEHENYYLNNNVNFSIKANEGYIVESILINNEPLESLATRSFIATETSYEITVNFVEGELTTYDIYFQTPSSYSFDGTTGSVYLYGSSGNNGGWPGVNATWVSNEGNRNTWVLNDVDLSIYNGLIFVITWNDGQVQTVDLSVEEIINGNNYFIFEENATGAQGKFNGTWTTYSV